MAAGEENRETTQEALISLVVPVYNEQEVLAAFFARIEPVVAEIIATTDRIARAEVVFVDDGSTDRTVEEILAHRSEVLDLKLVKLSRNFRKDNALAAGLMHAGGDAVIPMDADLQDPPEVIGQMVSAWLDGAKVVNAKRASRGRDSFLKRTSSRMFYKVINRLSEYPIEPDVGDFRLFDRQVVDILNDMPERVRFMKGMFAWVGFAPVTIEYDRDERAEGDSKWTYWKLWNFALDGITGSTTLPIRAWTYFGFCVAVLAVVSAVFLILRTLIFGIDVPGYASLMVITLFLGACNLIALGMMGEYIGRLTVETKKRPVFVVDEVIERKSQS
jgi:glycosyltransferase involved in cell wall biosynthesis